MTEFLWHLGGADQLAKVARFSHPGDLFPTQCDERQLGFEVHNEAFNSAHDDARAFKEMEIWVRIEHRRKLPADEPVITELVG